MYTLYIKEVMDMLIKCNEGNNNRFIVHLITYKGNLKLGGTIDCVLPEGNHQQYSEKVYITPRMYSSAN